MRKNKLVRGKGKNDYDGILTVDGKIIKSYTTWDNMLARCYSGEYQKTKPSYVGCYVCDDWLNFSEFKKWFDENYVEGWQLDKDLIDIKNKMYSPSTCVFIPGWLNSFNNDCRRSRGELVVGVNRHRGRYKANCCVDGVQTYLGLFDTEIDAHRAWKKRKLENLGNLRERIDSIDPRIYSSILSRVETMYGNK